MVGDRVGYREVFKDFLGFGEVFKGKMGFLGVYGRKSRVSDDFRV